MPRKKAIKQEELFIHPLIIRVNEKTYQRLEKLLEESGCRSLGEVARKLLSNEKINCFYTDKSLNGPMEELSLIRKELKAIGVNINQQTRYFNASKSTAEKNYHAAQTTRFYFRVEAKMERLFILIAKLTDRWLPRS